MPGPNMMTWWRADGATVDFVMPDEGWCLTNEDKGWIRGPDTTVVSVIRLAPGEAFMRWEEPERGANNE